MTMARNAKLAMSWAWLAGFTDGDGCISVHTPANNRARVRVRWSQKAEDGWVLDFIFEFLLKEAVAGVRTWARTAWAKGHAYPQSELCLSRHDEIEHVLVLLLPHLVLKREKAEEALDMLDRIRELSDTKGKYYRKPNNGGWGPNGPRTLAMQEKRRQRTKALQEAQ